jgi:CSLREA domain-containing protein
VSGGLGEAITTHGTEKGAKTEILNCTFSGNGIANTELPYIAEVSVGNSIFSNSPISTQGGSFSQVMSLGYNLSTDNGNGRLTATGDQINTDPKFDPQGLQFNGGPTRTIALVSGSPALDQGKSNGLTRDQRDYIRPVDNPAIANASGGDGSDIGAFEASTDVLQSGPTFVVNTHDDHDDGHCGVTDCSLRDAVLRSNTLDGLNTITFAQSVTGTIALDSALGHLVVSGPTTFNGPGARILRISGNNMTRLLQFTFLQRFSQLNGLTLHGGRAETVGRPGAGGIGGAILNQAQLTVRDCTFVANYAVGTAGLFPGEAGGSGNGGAVGNEGFVHLERCTFGENVALGATGAANSGSFTTGGAGGEARGGAVYNSPNSTVGIYNCTFANNLAQGGSGGSAHFGGAGGAARGAAIYNERDIGVYASTISNNTAGGGNGGTGSSSFNNGAPGQGVGGVEATGTGSTHLQNCIVAANFGNNGGGADVQGTFVSTGYNLIGIGDTSSGFNATGDQVGTFAAPINPKLGLLQDNGGTTDTMALLNGSPAIDQGISGGNVVTDQRGQSRPNDNPFIPNANGGNGSDIGAFELGGLLVITTVADFDDGACTASHCTLREAINAANALSGDDVIAFLPGVSGTIQLASALPALSSDITLQGPGSGVVTVRRNTGGTYRIFTVSNGFSTGPTVTISGLTIANGRAAAGAFPTSSGGGILSDHANLTVQACVFTGNASDPSGFTYGGGIFNNEGTLVVEQSTFTNNDAYYGAGICIYDATGGSGAVGTIRNSTFAANDATYGGAVYNQAINNGSSADMSVTNSTLSGNAATNAGGAIYNSGALSGSAYTSLTDCTVNANSAPNGGGIYNFSNSANATVFLRNNILRTIASGGNVFNNGGTVTSSGNNLTNDNTGFASNSGDIRNTDPMLGPLAFNGGLTQTHALLSGSLAINAGTSFFAPTQDQRGFFYVGANDIGAYELNGIELRITSITRLANGDIQLQGSGSPNGAHTILAALLPGPRTSYASIGTATANASGVWQFTDTAADGFTKRFYEASFP